MAERIQSALAKARAKRAARLGEPVEARLPEAPVPEAIDVDHWAALPAIEISDRQLERSRILTRSGSDAAMPFDVLRTRMLRELRANGWRRVAITSPDSGCGKSTVAANLAFSLARQPDLRTILIEADMRQPALARMLGIKSPPQFSRVLNGSATLPAELLRHGANLCIALNGKSVEGSAELLQHSNVSDVIARMEQMLAPSVILFDMPPMLNSDDTLAFLDKVDCALLVVAADRTSLQDADQCVQNLSRHTKTLGVVLNKLKYVAETTPTAYGP